MSCLCNITINKPVLNDQCSFVNFILLTTASVHPSVRPSTLAFEVFNQHDLDFCMYAWMMPISRRGLKIWKSKT